MQKKNKYPKPRVIAVDVDGTLFVNGELNESLVKWCKEKKDQGFHLMLWSMRGEKHARKAASIAGLLEVSDVITSKPGYIVDNDGWSWIKYTEVVRGI